MKNILLVIPFVFLLFIPGCMNAKVNANATANAEIKTKLDSLIQAQAQAQIGIGNKIDSQTNDLKAGHDVIQFNEQMLDALKSANDVSIRAVRDFAYVMISIITAAALCICVVFHRYKIAAEQRLERTIWRKNKL